MGVVDANVLVLNLDYQPLNVCNVRRAVVLLDKQKAVVIEQNGHIVMSERLSIQSPSVIRLAYHIKRPRSVLKMIRKEVLIRDDHTCQYCARRGHAVVEPEVVPVPGAVLAGVVDALEHLLTGHLEHRAKELDVIGELD